MGKFACSRATLLCTLHESELIVGVMCSTLVINCHIYGVDV